MVAQLLRDAGYSVAMSPKSRGVFDLVATRGDACLAVQVKFYSRSCASPRPYHLHARLMSGDLPAGARRIYWVVRSTDLRHHVVEITPTAWRDVAVSDLTAI